MSDLEPPLQKSLVTGLVCTLVVEKQEAERESRKNLKNTLIERTKKTIFKAFLGFEKPAKACFNAPKTITKV